MKPSGQRQIGIFSAIVAAVTVIGLGYICVAQPDYLRRSREGVRHLSPPVEHPETGEAVSLDRLIRHYKGQ